MAAFLKPRRRRESARGGDRLRRGLGMDHEGTLTFKGQGWEAAEETGRVQLVGKEMRGVPRPGNLGGAISRTQGGGCLQTVNWSCFFFSHIYGKNIYIYLTDTQRA